MFNFHDFITMFKHTFGKYCIHYLLPSIQFNSLYSANINPLLYKIQQRDISYEPQKKPFRDCRKGDAFEYITYKINTLQEYS